MARSALHRGLPSGSCLAAALIFTLVPASSFAQDDPRQKQISELEKQLHELGKKLDELKQSRPATSVSSTPDGTIPADWIKSLSWRCIGPANMGGRITAISVFEADPSTYWIATASGGLLKTTNNGITFEHQFDQEATVSVGDVCVSPSDRNVVWVGTGE